MAAAALALAACNTSYEKSPSGLVYKIFGGSDTQQLKPQGFAKLNIEFTLPEKKDSVLSTTYGTFPFYTRIDTGKRTEYSFMEVLSKCKAGDSAVIIISMDTLVNRKLIAPNAPFLVKNGTIKCTMKILGAFATDSLAQADFAKEEVKEKEREQKSAEDFAAKKGWKTQKTPSGLLIVIDNPGDGAKADTGKLAMVKYRGYLQKDESVIFDTNMDSTKGPTDPYGVPVGRGKVIPAWDEALPYFAKGGKGKLVVPAYLAYGPQRAGANIPENSNLVFDMEIVDVKDAPPPAEKPAPPMPSAK